MEEYAIRVDSPEKFVVMHKDELNLFYDIAVTTNEYWACRIVDALIFEKKTSASK